MRVLICGSRYWEGREEIREKITKLFDENKHDMLVIHGAARGADTIAGEEASKLGIPVEAYPADWKKYGRAAGAIRNTSMISIGKPDLVLAFHEDLNKSKGTANMVRQARKAGIPVVIYGGS